VGEVLRDENVGQMSTEFIWAPTGPDASVLPRSLMLESTQAPSILKAAELMHQERVQYSDIYTGRIVRMSHEGDDFYSLTVQTVRRGHATKIDVLVSRTLHDQAATWYVRQETVVVEGVVRRGPSRGWLMDAPQRLHPLHLEQLTLE